MTAAVTAAMALAAAAFTELDACAAEAKAGGVRNDHASGRHWRHHSERVGAAAAAAAAVAVARVILHLHARRSTGDAVLV